jgi:uncharacterized protein
MKISRRSFLSLIPVQTALWSGTSSFGMTDVTEDVEVSLLEVSLPDLPAEFEGYRIAFLSDLHYGVTFSESLLERIVTYLANSELDLLLLGGDYVYVPLTWLSKHEAFIRNREFLGLGPYQTVSAIFGELGRRLNKLSMPDGIIGIYGNHDRWHNPTACQDLFDRIGAKLLVNDVISINRGDKTLTIFGTDDFLTGFPTPPPQKISGEVNILLTHNPDYVAALLRTGHQFRPHLTLCGHTHGGQIALPYVGALHYNIYTDILGCGTTSLEHGFIYTGRGLGTVEIPLRIGVRPELPVFTLKKGPRLCHLSATNPL